MSEPPRDRKDWMCGDGKGYADASIPALSSCALTGRCRDGGPAPQADAETAGRHKVSSANRRPNFHIWHLPIGGEVWLRSLRLPIRLSYLSKLTNRRARFLCYFKFDEQSSNILSADMKHHDYEGPLSRSLKLCRGKAPRKRRLISRSLESGSSAKGKSVKKELTS